MAHRPDWPHHPRSGQGSRMCAASIKARPALRAPSLSLCLAQNRRPKNAGSTGPASLNRRRTRLARPAQSTNPHSSSRAARGFLHVRISYAQAPEILRHCGRSTTPMRSLKAAVCSRAHGYQSGGWNWPLSDGPLTGQLRRRRTVGCARLGCPAPLGTQLRDGGSIDREQPNCDGYRANAELQTAVGPSQEPR